MPLKKKKKAIEHNDWWKILKYNGDGAPGEVFVYNGWKFYITAMNPSRFPCWNVMDTVLLLDHEVVPSPRVDAFPVRFLWYLPQYGFGNRIIEDGMMFPVVPAAVVPAASGLLEATERMEKAMKIYLKYRTKELASVDAF